MSEGVSRKVASLLEGSSIKDVFELAELVDNKEEFSEWEFYWRSLLMPK